MMWKMVRSLWPLLVLGLLVNTAYSVMWPLTTIYLHNNLGLSLVMSGLILAVYSGFNVLGGYLGGVLTDRLPVKRVGLALLLGLVVDALAGLIWNGRVAYPIVLVVFGLLTGGMLTLITAMAAHLSRGSGRLFNVLYIFINLGLVVGTASIGILFHHSLQPIFLLLVVCYGLATALWLKYADRLVQPVRGTGATVAVTTTPAKPAVLGTVQIAVILLSLTLMWLTYAQWMSNVSVYIQDQGLPIRLYSHLWVYNGVLLIVVQSLMTKVSRTKTLSVQITLGLVAIGGSFLLLSSATGVTVLFLAMTLLTLGEAIYVPGVPALINAYTVGNEGKYQGLVNAFSSLGKAVGPVLGGLIIGSSQAFSRLFLLCGTVNVGIVVILLVIVRPALQKANEPS
ncbi:MULTISPECIES: MFS transporter [Lactobacillaceae]|uniref:MFS transporter n=2 Tax=Lactobacillales TaxID=186826 RepID=UPI001E3637A5|nr:MFS transporter [Lactobacillus sp. HBUAS51381]